MMSRDGLKCEQLTRERWWPTMKVRYTIPYSGAASLAGKENYTLWIGFTRLRLPPKDKSQYQ